nr:ISKra4 family transposase [Fimbriiglobus ruber]
MDCPHCRATAAFHGYRERHAESLGGRICCRRAYYYCRSCGHGTAPWDPAVGLTERRLTPAVERLATLTGAVADSFENGAELLAETSGIRLRESTVERTTAAAGKRIAAVLSGDRGLGKSKPWAWHCDAWGRTVGYIALDATGIRPQGRGGVKADGRMAYVGMIFNPLPDRERVFEKLPKPGTSMTARYVSGLYPLSAIQPRLAPLGDASRGWIADVQIALSDGGAGREDLLRDHFGRVEVVILDFFHAAEHLGKLAKAWHPQDEPAAREQTAAWSRLLRDEGGDAMIAVLEEGDIPSSASARSIREEVRTYFRNQCHRMDDPTYEANGWFIGSGAVESACKTVVGSRLKGSGMRWSESGGDAVCHVRALYRSEPSQWQAFWQRDLAA